MGTLKHHVVSRFIENVDRFPNRPAIFVDGQHHTYMELSRQAMSIRQQLLDAGMANEKIIGILANEDVYTYAAILAILSLDSAFVPLNDKNPQHRNQDISDDTDLKVILTSDPNHQAIHDLTGAPALISTNRDSHGEELLESNPIEKDSLAYILFTSGSTGKPKGVPISHTNLNAFLDITLDNRYFSYDENDKFLQMFELTFDFSISSYLLPFSIGACTYVVPRRGISYMNIASILKEHEITVSQMVPSVICYLERFFDELSFPSVRYSIFCGEPLPDSITRKWQKVIPNAKIINMYGPTEATVYCYQYDWSENAPAEDLVNGIISIGEAWRGIEGIIVGADDSIITEGGTKGELCIKGDQVFKGYWNNPEKTNAAFLEIPDGDYSGRYYRTGDQVSLNENRNLIHHGRIDFQVKINGHRVELGEIEHHIREITGSNLVAAILKNAELAGKELLIVHVESNKEFSHDEVINELEELVPPYMIPKKILRIDKMPMNQNGKIDRNALLS